METIPKAISAGANRIVAASAIFKTGKMSAKQLKNYKMLSDEQIKKLERRRMIFARILSPCFWKRNPATAPDL